MPESAAHCPIWKYCQNLVVLLGAYPESGRSSYLPRFYSAFSLREMCKPFFRKPLKHPFNEKGDFFIIEDLLLQVLLLILDCPI
jgi:hypothetical protein